MEGIEVKVAEIAQRSKSNSHRLDKIEERQDNLDELVSSVAALATKQECMEGDVKEIKTDVKTLTAKPGKRWEAIADKVVWAILAALIAFLLGRIGL